MNQSEQVKADKTFAFTAEQLTQHFSPSELGASYSIWIPWDAADGFREEVTLIPTFKGTDGVIVQGAPAKLYLPGRSTELGVGARDSASSIPTQSVFLPQTSIPTNDGVDLPKAKREELKSLTIELPSSNSLLVARPRPKPKDTYTLGEAPTAPARNQSLPTAGQGVSVGGQAYQTPLPTVPQNFNLPSTAASTGALPTTGSPVPAAMTPQAAVTEPAAAATATDANNSSQLPKSFALPAIRVRELPAPTQRHLKRLGSPIAHEPWTTQQSIVQPASFSN